MRSDRCSGLSQTPAEAGLEMMKRPESSGRRREDKRRWRMQVVHGGYGPMRTLLGTCWKVLLADETPSFRSDQSGGLRESYAHLASGLLQESKYEASPCRYPNAISARVYSYRREVEELLQRLWKPSLDHWELSVLQALFRWGSTNSRATSRAWTSSLRLQRDPSDPPDRRLPCSPSSIRAVWGETCDGLQPTRTLSGSADSEPHLNAARSTSRFSSAAQEEKRRRARMLRTHHVCPGVITAGTDSNLRVTTVGTSELHEASLRWARCPYARSASEVSHANGKWSQISGGPGRLALIRLEIRPCSDRPAPTPGQPAPVAHRVAAAVETQTAGSAYWVGSASCQQRKSLRQPKRKQARNAVKHAAQSPMMARQSETGSRSS